MPRWFSLYPIQLLALAFVLFSFPFTLGGPQNVTCDDQFGCEIFTDAAIIDFIPSTGWTQGSTCKGCKVQPQRSQAYEQTWHDSTLDIGKAGQRLFNITFHGTAIYTFFIVPDNVTHFAHEVTLLANMSVFLDDELVGNILHVPDNKTDFIYNFLGYVNTSLSNDAHMLSISANNEVASSLILFDYYIYTTDSSLLEPHPTLSSLPVPSVTLSTSNSSPSSVASRKPVVGPVIGGVLSGLVLCGFVVAYILWKRKRLRAIEVTHETNTSPDHYPSGKYGHQLYPPSNSSGGTASESAQSYTLSYAQSVFGLYWPVRGRLAVSTRVQEWVRMRSAAPPAYESRMAWTSEEKTRR